MAWSEESKRLKRKHAAESKHSSAIYIYVQLNHRAYLKTKFYSVLQLKWNLYNHNFRNDIVNLTLYFLEIYHRMIR